MKKLWMIFVLCLILCVGCGNTEDLREEGQQQNTELGTETDSSNDEDQQSQDEQQEEVKEETQSVWDESKAVTMATSSNVNFRTEPNTECEIIQVLKQYTEV